MAKHQSLTFNFGSEHCPILATLKKGWEATPTLDSQKARTTVSLKRYLENSRNVQEDSEAVAKLLAKDALARGFLLDPRVPNLANATVQPTGVVEQFSLQEDGWKTLKRRLTQDLSFPWMFRSAPGNKRINVDVQVEMICGLSFCQKSSILSLLFSWHAPSCGSSQ